MLRVKGFMLLAIAMLCTACIAPQKSCMVAVDGQEWSNEVAIQLENSDTLSLRELAVALRYNSSLKATELPLKIKVITPEGELFEEPFSLQLTNTKRATTLSQSIALPYRHDVILAKRGLYTFVFEPCDTICGIEAIGIEITTR